MRELNCPGWPASSLTAWLAAIGATHLDRGLKLHWTTDAEPFAVLSSDDGSPPMDHLRRAWPTAEALERMPTATLTTLTGEKDKEGKDKKTGRKIALDDFIEKAKALRGRVDAWDLSSTMTDLHIDENGLVAHAPLDPPMSKGPSLHQRLKAAHRSVKDVDAHLAASASGAPMLAQCNGLAFTIARLGGIADWHKNFVDPVIETLAFHGLAVFPFRGDGTTGKIERTRQRGWRRDGSRNIFRWPAWSAPLNLDAIDALLDAWPMRRDSGTLLGVHAAWESVRYIPRGKADSTRGFSSKRLR